jgi:hypothetical protein
VALANAATIVAIDCEGRWHIHGTYMLCCF